MHIHRDSRQGSERSPHAQMELRLWDLMPPRTNKQINKQTGMINVIHLSPFYTGMTLTLHRKLLFDSYVIFSSQMQITPDFIHILERL